jgi:hypothetical protein
MRTAKAAKAATPFELQMTHAWRLWRRRVLPQRATVRRVSNPHRRQQQQQECR